MACCLKVVVRLVLPLVLVALLGQAPARGESGKVGYVGPVKFNKIHSSYDVNPDGTYSQQSEIVIEVMNEEGVKLANTANITYSQSLQTIKNLSAFTLKGDGTKIPVPPANIQDRSVVDGVGPTFSDIKSKNIIFPDVAKGDKVTYSFTLVQNVPVFPGHFTLGISFTKALVYDDARVQVTVPVHTLALDVFASEVQGGRVPDAKGRMQWVWTYRSKEPVVPEPDSVAEIDYGPRIFVSSFKNYGSLGAAYQERAKPKATVTPNVKALATELTKGVTDQREQAKRIYTWVSQNIRYAGNLDGIGSIVPHDTDVILANRLGDCKDTSTLLQSLLAAKEISSIPVLVNYGDSYKLPEVPVLAGLNHVITYIPSLDVYLDPTSEYLPFGLLPIGVNGKPAVHIAQSQPIKTIPTPDFRINSGTMKMKLNIHEDGSAEGETTNTETGHLAATIKGAFAGMRPDMEDVVTRKIIAESGYSGTGKITVSEIRNISDSFTYRMTYKLSDAFNVPGPAALKIAPILPVLVSVSSTAGGVGQPERKVDGGCMGHVTSEEYVISLPKTVKILAVPRDVHKANTLSTYDATYQLTGNTITVRRKYQSMETVSVCTPEDDKKFRAIAREIVKDLRAQVMYQPAEEGDSKQ